MPALPLPWGLVPPALPYRLAGSWCKCGDQPYLYGYQPHLSGGFSLAAKKLCPILHQSEYIVHNGTKLLRIHIWIQNMVNIMLFTRYDNEFVI